MNRWVRLFFLPIMLIAGVVVGFLCAVIIAPFALCHRLRQLQATKVDLARQRELCRQHAERIYGKPEESAPAHTQS